MSNPHEPPNPVVPDPAVPAEPTGTPPVEAAASEAGAEPVVEPAAGAEAGAAPVDQPDRSAAQAERKQREVLRKSAQAVFDMIHHQLSTALYSESTTRETDDGVEDIPWEEQSYRQLHAAIAENMLGITYEMVDGKRRKIVASQQSFEQWDQALEWAKQITQDLVAETRAKISAAEERVRTKAQEKSPDNLDAYLNQIVKVSGAGRDRGGKISQRVAGFHKSLERLRLRALTDVVDWFRARVRQVEGMETSVTRRRDAKDTVPNRIARLDNDSDVAKALRKLNSSLELILSVSTIQPQVPQEQDKKYFAGQLVRRYDWAKRSNDYLQRAKERMQDVLTPNRQGRNRIEQAVDRVVETIPDRADLLTAMAREYTIGLSPEEERDFFEAMHDLFDDVGGENDQKFGTTEWRAKQSERWRTINGQMHLYELFQDGPVKRPRLVRAREGQPIVVNEEHIPANVDELFARAKQDAQLLGELRKKLRKTFAIMGPVFVKAVKTGLKDMPGGQRLDAVDQLNGAISSAQRQAVQALSGEADFATALAGRKVEDLKYRVALDRPLIERIRTKICDDLHLGKPDKLEAAAMSALFEVPPSADEVADEQEAAAEQSAAAPVVRQILNGEVDAALVKEAFPMMETVDDLQQLINNELRAIRDAVRSAPFREAMMDHLGHSLRGDGVASTDGLKEVMQQLWNIKVACEALTRAFGQDWPKLAGLLIPDPTDPRKFVADTEKIAAALTLMGYERTTFIQGVQLDDDATASAFFSKLDRGTRERLTGFGLTEGDVVHLVTYGLPVKLGEVDFVEPTVTMKRIANYLELGAAGKKGVEVLQHTGLAKVTMQGETRHVIFALDKVRTIINDPQFDRRA